MAKEETKVIVGQIQAEAVIKLEQGEEDEEE